MNEGNSNNQPSGSGSGSGGARQNSSGSGAPRVRRPSASIISSTTTTPMFQAPQNPNHQNQAQPQTSRQRHNIILQNHQHNYGPGDIDDDVPQASSSSSSSYSSSLRGRLSAGVGVSSVAAASSSSSNNFNNNRPQSPLGSPDSTAYWAPSPAAHPISSYRAPLTPGGVCAVSSSTSDDIPQSPFSPADGNSNHGFPMPHQQQHPQATPAPVGAAVPAAAGESGTNGRSPPAVGSNQNIAGVDGNNDFNLMSMGQQHHRRRPSLASSNVNRSVSSSSPSSSGSRGNNNHHRISSIGLSLSNQLQQGNQNQSQDLNQNSSDGNNGGASSSLHLHHHANHTQQSFNMSPLRNKIKKASSFERFSLAQAAITLNSTNGNNNASSSTSQSQNAVGVVGHGDNNASTSSSSSISSLPPTTTTGSIIITNSSNSGTNPHYTSNSVNVAASGSGSYSSSSRALWDPSPPPPPQTSSTEIITPSTSASGLRAFTNSHHGLSEKFHIKIPSKKLAAKIASVYEQEKLNEQLNNANLNNSSSTSAEGLPVVGSVLNKRSGLSSVIASVAGSSAMSQNDGLVNSSFHSVQQNHNSQSSTPSTLAQILNQSSSNIHVSNIMTTTTTTTTEESIMNQEVNHENLIRELGEAPLNLTDSASSSNIPSGSQISLFPQRNPVISSRTLVSAPSTHSKKIPLTPKQKLLHRLQSGELMASLSPPPPPIVTLSQQLSQQQQSLPAQTIQQQHTISSVPVVTMHQSLSSLSPDNLQSSGGMSHVVSIGNSSSSSHSPPSQSQQQQQQILDQYSYDQLLRARDDFVVQESLGKGVGDDPGILSVYDPADYSYYSYQNILGDEIFTGGNPSTSSSSSRQLLMMPSGSLGQMDPPHPGSLEFLGFSGQGDDHDGGGGDMGRDEDDDDDLQLNNIDPNDLSAMKSQINQASDSTLRNLLMMDTLRNSGHNSTADDNAWLSLAAEYQNRIINGDSMSLSRGGGGGMRSGGGGSGSNLIVGNIIGSNSSLSGGVPVMNNNMNNAWVNDWPRTSSWPTHSMSSGVSGGGSLGGVQDQDEVMDMSSSMIDTQHVKGPIPMSNQMKRLQMQMQSASASNNEHHHPIDEMDLTTSLPILSQMSVGNVSMPIDLQQPMSILSQHGGVGNSSGKDSGHSLPMDLQQHHHRMDIDDEPVNLMAVNMDQDLVSHHHQHSLGGHSSSSGHLNQSHLSSHSQNSSSYSLQIQSHHSPSELQQQHGNVGEMGIGLENNNSSSSPNSCPDNIDERRIIRAKKNKESLIMPNLEDDYQLKDDEQEHVNIIADRKIQPKSIASLPAPFRLSRISGNELAVFNNTNKNIPPNCRLGPVEGPLRKASEDIANMNAVYPSLVMADGNTDLWQLDRGDDEFCNWMKFVRLAHSIKDQNALVVESEGYLYFMTCKEISPNTEVQVGYSYEYAQKYGLPYLLPMDAFLDQDNRIMKDNSMMLNISNGDKGHSPPPHCPTSPPHPSQQQQLQIMHDEGVLEQEGLDQACEQEQQQEPSKLLTVEIYQCFECDEEFSLVEDLQAHLNAHRDIETIRKPKKKAIKKFHNLELDIHQASKNLATSAPRNNAIIPVVGKVQSQTMNADSSTVQIDTLGAEQEILGRTGDAPLGKQQQQDNSVSTGSGQPPAPPKVKCSMCYKSFLTKERLEKHMIVHSDEDTKPLKCNFCSKRFLTNSALAGHTKTHAEEGKFFECPMCKFSTPQLLSLKEHVQTHKSRDTGLFYCPRCPKKFSAYSMIRKHIRAFHGPRQFNCDVCDSSFPTSDKLKLHQLKHSDHREFLCALCGKQFKRKDKLREHTKRIHETKKKILELNQLISKDKNSKCSKFIPKVSPAEIQKFPFKCQDCMVGFKRRGMLVNHLAKRHPEKTLKSIPELNQPILRLTRNYPCLYCERVYKSSSKRKSHILKAHPGRPIPPQLRGTVNNRNAVVSELASTKVVTVNEDILRPLTTGTIVQTVTEDGDPRSGIMNVSCTNNTENNLVSTTSTSQSTRKEASIVGKVAALPHACQWCYRQYATRAKLLQHQRKAHISLMPAEMQTPRTQKNNVSKTKKDKAPNSEATATARNSKIPSITIKTEGNGPLSIPAIKPNNFMETTPSSIIIPDSTSTTASTTNTTSTIQTIATVAGDGFNDGNVIGYLLTTSTVSPSDLGNILPSELVMLGPVSGLNVNNGGSGTATILTPQSLALNSGNSSSQNITIIASSSKNSKSNT